MGQCAHLPLRVLFSPYLRAWPRRCLPFNGVGGLAPRGAAHQPRYRSPTHPVWPLRWYWTLADLTGIPDFSRRWGVFKERASLAALGGNQTAESQVLGKGDLYLIHRSHGISAGVAP